MTLGHISWTYRLDDHGVAREDLELYMGKPGEALVQDERAVSEGASAQDDVNVFSLGS